MTVVQGENLWEGTAMVLRKDGSPAWRYRVEPFREAAERSELSLHEIGGRMGYKDWTYITRVLGYRRHTGGWKRHAKNGTLYRYSYDAATINYETAVKLARILEMDFVALGI